MPLAWQGQKDDCNKCQRQANGECCEDVFDEFHVVFLVCVLTDKGEDIHTRLSVNNYFRFI